MKSSLLPPNATPLLRDLADVCALDLSPELLADMNAADRAPVAVLSYLAWALSIDEWDETWPEATRRQVIRESLGVHRSKGTVASVKRILRGVGFYDPDRGFEVHIIEGKAHSAEAGKPAAHWAEYSIELNRPMTIDQAALTRRLLGTVVPARCHLRRLDFRRAAWRHNGQARYDATISHGEA
ncbi:phage tail protein I [Chitinimonas sp. BJB300]|uniref:phage tail protein I n=1 Tax=Chitinimonas sp. BJB300 TaxID=1559339 RepID=UPI000C0E9F98|nr:phage tail protein I [Chitinimonas sp. BJB300]PHV11313.1 phage tail protein I [Chitinimonas sp. BJB300]TSJ88206.1 phage tail protein I [Chitinimonas sp. BJB300]